MSSCKTKSSSTSKWMNWERYSISLMCNNRDRAILLHWRHDELPHRFASVYITCAKKSNSSPIICSRLQTAHSNSFANSTFCTFKPFWNTHAELSLRCNPFHLPMEHNPAFWSTWERHVQGMHTVSQRPRASSCDITPATGQIHSDSSCKEIQTNWFSVTRHRC